MQINGSTHHATYPSMTALQDDGKGFRPIRQEDLTLSGIMRRISEMNLGTSIDLQA